MTWDEDFAYCYEEWSAHTTGDIPFYVELARRANGPIVELDLREADMRNLTLDEPAALIYCPFRALLHLPTHTSSPAWTVPTMTAQYLTPSATPWATTESTRSSTTAPKARSAGRQKNEWLSLIDVAGLQLEALYGGFNNEPFTDESREYVFVTRR